MQQIMNLGRRGSIALYAFIVGLALMASPAVAQDPGVDMIGDLTTMGLAVLAASVVLVLAVLGFNFATSRGKKAVS